MVQNSRAYFRDIISGVILLIVGGMGSFVYGLHSDVNANKYTKANASNVSKKFEDINDRLHALTLQDTKSLLILENHAKILQSQSKILETLSRRGD